MESRVVTIGNKGATQSQQFAWYCLCFVVLIICTKQALAGTTPTITHSYAGPINFAVIGGSVLNSNECNTNTSNRQSSRQLTAVPANGNVIAAFLYWAGTFNEQAQNSGSALNSPDTNINFTSPTGTRSVSADDTYTDNFEGNTEESYYSNVADVTRFVSGDGLYRISGLNIHTEAPHCNFSTLFGGWALIVVYESAGERNRVINIFDGFDYYYGSSINLSPSNFTVSEQPDGKLAHITWEGDANINEDRNGVSEELRFNGSRLPRGPQGNNPRNNPFNSYSSAFDSSTYTVDIDTYEIDNLLSPGDTSASTTYSTGRDLVFLSAEVISVTNIPVSDLQIQNLTPNSVWDKNISQPLSFRLTNNGPANVNAFDTQFELQLPTNTNYVGPAPAGFNCSATSALVTCQKTTEFASNSFIDVSINIDASNVDTSAGLASETFTASIDHDLANSPSLFDNRQLNNVINVTQGISELDYSSSAILLTDANAGLFLSGDPIAVDLSIFNGGYLNSDDATITIDIPSHVASFSVDNTPTGSNVTTIPDGGANGTGQIIISNIDFSANENPNITLTLNTDPAIEPDSVYSLTAVIDDNNQSWTISSNDLIVSDGTLPASGNKQLYLNNNPTMSRERPSNLNGTVDIARGLSQTWELTPALQDDLTFSLDDIRLEINLMGNGVRTGLFTGTQTSYQAEYNLSFSLSDSAGNLLADKSVAITPSNSAFTLQTITLDNKTGSQDIQLPIGQRLLFTILNNSNSFFAFPYTFDPAEISIKVQEAASSTALADGYSALILNAQTVINIDSIEVWSEPFDDNDNDGIDDSGAQLITSSQPDTQLSVRATVSDPFGAFDISSAFITVNNASISNQAMVEIDDKIPDDNTATKSFETIITLAEEGETLGNWNISVIANEGIEGDVSHTRSSNFMVLPFQPNVGLSKTIEVINDPINGPLSAGNNPKAIPGAEIQYTISAINTGRGKGDTNSIVLLDEIPQNAELFIGDLACSNRGPGSGLGPICFEDGASPNESGLTYDFNSITDLSDNISFSVNGSDFTYEPSDEGDGYDSNIRFIRISPSGELLNASKDGSTEPSFNFMYQIRLQ